MNIFVKTIHEMLGDNKITNEVTKKIQNDPNIPFVDSKKISIKVQNGVVTLLGNVRSVISKPLAYIDAISVHGVRLVKNNINISNY